MSTKSSDYKFNNYCEKCGLPKIYIGDNTNVAVCQCPIKSNHRVFVNTGWVCPVCGAGNSPFTTQCPCNKTFTIGMEVTQT